MKSANNALIKEARELPLKTEISTQVDPETGLSVTVTRHERGLLQREEIEYLSIDDDGFIAWMDQFARQTRAQAPMRKQVEDFCDNVRKRLLASGLPTDKDPRWVSIDGGKWRPLVDGEKIDPSLRVSHARWSKRVEELTEPVSILRYAAQLLEGYTVLLKIDGIDAHLGLINKIVNTHFDYRFASSYNKAAVAGVKATKSRKAGPSANHERSMRLRAIVRKKSVEIWQLDSRLMGDVSNTAAYITKSVNDDVAALGLGGPRSIKTVADHLRKARQDILSEMANLEPKMASLENLPTAA